MTSEKHDGWLGTSSVLVALAISAVGATFREWGPSVQMILMAVWMAAGAAITWRRTPLRAIPGAVMLLATALLGLVAARSALDDFFRADPWRLLAIVPGIVALGVLMSAAHKHDAKRYPKAHAAWLAALRRASFRDMLTYRHVPTIEVDPFTDPDAVTR
jgi:hypothetical protein